MQSDPLVYIRVVLTSELCTPRILLICTAVIVWLLPLTAVNFCIVYVDKNLRPFNSPVTVSVSHGC